MKNFYFTTLIAALFFVACQGPQKPTYSSDFAKKRIDSMQKVMRGYDELDTALAGQMMKAYQRYVDSFPQDSLAAVYLLKKADIQKLMPNQQQEALTTYRRVVDQYRYTPQGPRAVMASALLYEQTGAKGMAIASYNFLIANYPSNPLAADAKNLRDMLMNPEKDPLKQIENWKKKAKETK